MKKWLARALVSLGLVACGPAAPSLAVYEGPVSEQGARVQEMIDCCQRIYTIAQYQDHQANYQVGRCMTAGQAAIRAGDEAYATWKTANCSLDPSQVNGGSSGGGSGSTPPSGETLATSPVVDGGTDAAVDGGTASAVDGGTGSGSGGQPCDGESSSCNASVNLKGTIYAMGTSPQLPLSGATVRVFSVTSEGSREVAETTTDGTGTYRVHGLSETSYALQIQSGNATAELTDVAVSSSTVKVLDVQIAPALLLTAECSATPATTRRWRVTNPLSTSVIGWWEAVGTHNSGRLSFPAGDSYFSTPASTALVRLTVSGTQVDAAAPVSTQCPSAPASSPAAAPTSVTTVCDVLQPGCGNQACYQFEAGNKCDEIRYDCCCVSGSIDFDPWRPGTCQAG